MDQQLIEGISHYKVELSVIKKFLSQPKTTGQWQDWLRRTSPEKSMVTKKLPARARIVDDPVFGIVRRYPELLTWCIKAGMVSAQRMTDGQRLYTWVVPSEGS